MFVLILLLISFLNAETFYLSSKKTSFYQINVQVNGNDISDKIINSDKVVLDQYVVEGTNILSVCYRYNPDQGQPNVKQLSKVELYNTKVSTKIRGLAHITPKKVVPEYISVSPQPRAFSTQEQQCVTHNFEDYTPERLQAMETMFNPAPVENIAETIDPVPTDNEPDRNLEPQQQALSDSEIASDKLINANTEGPDNVQEMASSEESAPIMQEADVVQSPPVASEPVMDETSAQEALSFIPEEDFVVPTAPPADTEVVEQNNFTEEAFPTDMSNFEEGQVAAFDETPQEEVTVDESNSDMETVPEDAFVFEEPPQQDGGVADQDRGVASDEELSDLSDEDFFEELEIQ